jgi:hypothetical protein
MLPLANIQHFVSLFMADPSHIRPRDYQDNSGSNSRSLTDEDDSVIVAASLCTGQSLILCLF